MKEKNMLNSKEIKYELLIILKDVIEFLDKNDIKYFIWAGSFLGAVRHKGFIPWDDDVDIALERKEYMKLVKCLNDNDCKINQYDAIGFELNSDYFPFIKIINPNIELDEEDGGDRNLWIDIFPLDYIPRKKMPFYFFELKLLRKIYYYRRAKMVNLYNKLNFFKKFEVNIICLFNFDKIIDRFINKCSKYSNSECKYITNNVWGVMEKELFEKKLLEDSCLYDFENIKVCGIMKSDIWLSTRYGNYMVLPPEEKRITHEYKAWRNDNE